LPPFDFASIRKNAGNIRDYQVPRFILCPDNWGKYPNRLDLDWHDVKFTQDNKELVPRDQAGIYSFVAIPKIANHPACSYLLYIGMTERQNFRDRYSQYLREGSKRKPRWHILNMLTNWSGHLWFYYAPVSDRSIISQLEDDLIESFLPPYNYEYPASIRDVMAVLFK
jgi:hypothetical protein